MHKRLFVLIIFICLTLIPLSGCGTNHEDEDLGSSAHKGDSQSTISSNKGTRVNSYGNLVINGSFIGKDNYLVEKNNGQVYILLPLNVLQYAFPIPYSTSNYPEVSTDNGQISITWSNEDQVIVKIDMAEGSTEAYINESNEAIDMGIAPKTVEDTLYIPINLLVDTLKMKETYDNKLDITYLHNEEGFPKNLLVGTWSDTDTDLFSTFEDASGATSLSSFAMSYRFEKNGTYKLLMVGVGGFEDTLLQCSGKYKIIGNIIVCYDILETLYEGTPFKLVHKNKKLTAPSFEYIMNYDADEEKIELGAFWLNRIE